MDMSRERLNNQAIEKKVKGNRLSGRPRYRQEDKV